MEINSSQRLIPKNMLRLVVLTFLWLIASCKARPKIIDPNIAITLIYAQSYQYSLTTQTYTVYRIFNPDTTIHFELAAKEREEIIKKYYDLELDILDGKQSVEDDCRIMPKLFTTLEVKSRQGFQEFVIDEACNDFKSGFAGQGKRIQTFLKFIDKIVKSKPEIMNAPKSDIMYL